jgi:hypothetical protein
MGLPYCTKFNPPYNSKGISSFMMPYELGETLAIHGMFCIHGCQAIAVFGDPPRGLRCIHSLVGLRLDPDADYWETLREFREQYEGFGFQRFITPKSGPRVGSSMVHAMTGRMA